MTRKQKPIFDYDKKNDILYVDLVYPSAAFSEEVNNSIYIRIDPKMEKVVGLTILAFKEKTTEDFRSVSNLGINWNKILEMV